jgi:integrase
MKLTATNIRTLTLPADKSEVIIFDDEIPGFGLRIRKTGGRSLIFQYGRRSTKGRTPKTKIGSVGAIDFGKARKIAKNYYAQVQMGQDPAQAKAEARAAAVETFGSTVALFLARERDRLRPRSYAEKERHLVVHARVLHGVALGKVTRRDISTLHVSITENIGARAADLVRASISSFYAWAVQRGLVESNPVIGSVRNTPRSRNRVLQPEELRLIWTHAGEDHYGAIVRLLMLCGARASEIANLCWSEIHDGLAVLPPGRVKNGRTHEIPLPAAAREIIEAQPRRFNADGKPRDLIFGFGHGPGGFSGWSSAKKRLDERITKAAGTPIADWRVHDLRRAFSTHANELGILPHIVESCLGHQSFRAGVASVYNLATYRPEKRAALERWADQLLAWVEGRETNIVTLRQA